MKKLIFILPACFLIYLACEKVTLVPETIDPDVGIPYTEIQEIFDNNCISCHNGGQVPDLSEGNSYQALINGGYIDNPTDFISTVLYQKLTGDHKSRINDAGLQKIQTWLEQGAKENVDPNATSNVDYIKNLQPVFNNICTECHNDRRAPDLRDGGSYIALLDGGFIDNPTKYESTALYIALQASRHTSIITEDTLKIIYDWLKDGAPEPEIFDSTLNIGYKSGIQVVFDNSCLLCHNGSQDPDLTDTNSYQALLDGDFIDTLSTDYTSAELYTVLTGSHLYRATYAELQEIAAWLSDGAVGPPKPIDPTVQISLANDIQPIFTSKCVSCHGGSRDPDLSVGNTYSSMSSGGFITNPADYAETELYKKLEGTHAGRMSDEEMQLLVTWLEQGAQDN